ncbi:SpaH/EbpB family LPXTG-anchored major pilin [Enemella sp. A6]|uniref:SpaH/EbpB family LPXTG-anchored major pilin n=1 Tax=Enemella sp. A6 TaxID=3440152 RepID=UPI003EBA4E73
MSHLRSLRHVLALGTAILLALLGWGSTAHADGTIADPALIDPNAAGSVTVHKYLGAPFDQPATGTPIEVPADARPLAGVTFTANRVVDVDLTTNEGWAQARQYYNNIERAYENLGETITSAPTDAQGVTVFGDLPVGLYLIREVQVDPTITPVNDFLITVPLTDPDARDSWLYDLHVYPKNERLTITKTVADGNIGVPGEDAPVPGTVMTFTLSADIPQNLTPGGGYALRDDLSAAAVPGSGHHTSDYLQFAAADWRGEVSAGVAGKILTPCPSATATDCDYRLDQQPAVITVEFTERGVNALIAAKAADATSRVILSLQARYRTDAPALAPGGVVELPNQALLYPHGLIPGATPITSPPTVSKYAVLQLHKIDGRSGQSLGGAEFALYRTVEDARSDAERLAVTGPTGSDGMARISHVHVSDFVNGAEAEQSYWVREIVTPRGYRTLRDPIEVRLLSDGSMVAADGTGGFPIANDKSLIPGLPDTGFGGPLVTGGTSLALLLAAAAVLLTLRRRRERETTQ